MMWRIPIEQWLVPDEPPPEAGPAETTFLDQPLIAGLPFALPLNAGWSLLLTLPTGQALRWREADPSLVVASSTDEELAGVPSADATRTPLRLLVRRGDGQWVGVIPLAAPGRTVVVPGDRARPDAALMVTLISWEVRAGNLVGPGDWGGRIRLAWRRADRPRIGYEPAPLNPYAMRRLAAHRETAVGLAQDAEALLRAQREWRQRRTRTSEGDGS
jgi:hypothetical protein